MIATTPYSIIVAPIGDIDPELCDSICKGIVQAFGFPCEIKPLLKDLTFAFNAERLQYHSTPILEKLAALIPASAIKVIAVTQVDLFIPILTHVYGEAQLGGKTCIISTCRLAEKNSLADPHRILICRAIKEAIHELGHTFNLRHCRERSCIMHYCRCIKDVDGKSEHICRYCTVMLHDEIKRLCRQAYIVPEL